MQGAGMTGGMPRGSGNSAPATAADPLSNPPPAVMLLDPRVVRKYIDAMPIPPVMPRSGWVVDTSGQLVDYYEIAARQLAQQILPETDLYGNTLGTTAVWGYGSIHHPSTFSYPGYTIEARHNRPVRVKWINQLVCLDDGKFLPHLFAVDQTLHWANPPGEPGGSMSGGMPMPQRGPDQPGNSQRPYTGPVPTVTHVHGAHTTEDSDGYPEAWYLPVATNLPLDAFRVGSKYHYFQHQFLTRHSLWWEPGTATYQYPNDQRATTLWYHDHTLGMTRVNVYAGLAGFYLIRGGLDDQVRVKGSGTPAVLPGPAPSLGDPTNTRYHEIPILIQDRTFWKDGSFFYPESREYFEGGTALRIPYAPAEACGGTSDVAPISNPEFFGDCMVVNGRTWPFVEVEQRRYRFRFLNGCNSRTLILKLEGDQPFWLIGCEGGFLRQPVECKQLVVAPAVRADVIIDFSAIPVDTRLKLLNVGPDSPFQGLDATGALFNSDPNATDPIPPADPETTGQVLEFRVVAATGPDPSTPPDQLDLPNIAPLGPSSTVRKLSLNELDSMTVKVRSVDSPPALVLDCASTTRYGPIAALLGTVDNSGQGVPQRWMNTITETPSVGVAEVWEIHNFTMDAHPIHLHQITFEVVGREYVDVPDVKPRGTAGTPAPMDPTENGRKDTIIANPSEITRILVKFDIPGLFVWHCHILEHEDNEMMRPVAVGAVPIEIAAQGKVARTPRA